nr:unnamed protein product [Callosobruchus analis]
MGTKETKQKLCDLEKKAETESMFTVNSYSLKLQLLKNRINFKGTKIIVAEDIAHRDFDI